MFKQIPKALKIAKIELPPLLKRGRVNPKTGRIPIATPILMNT